MRRISIAVLGVLAVSLLTSLGAGTAVGQSDDEPPDRPTVRMARATWDTGWFQAEIYRLLIQRLGYQVEGPSTMDVDDFYQAVAAGDVELWANGWFPTQDSYLQEGLVELVGHQVKAGALQGYFVDRATAETHGITNLGDLSSPELAAVFDRDGDGLADLIGCEPSWGCAAIIEHHLGGLWIAGDRRAGAG